MSMTQEEKEYLISNALETSEGRAALASAMANPIRTSLDYQGIGRKLLVVDPLPQGALPVYDRERTICDCFKYRTKLDNETFNKALNAYVADDNKNLSNLSKYAKEMKVYKKVMDLMEVLLNG